MPPQPPAVSGLQAAYAQLKPQLLRFLVARLRSKEDAEDVLQDVALKLLNAQVGPIAHPESYLFRMAHNLANDRLRGRVRRERREEAYADEACQGAAHPHVDQQPSAEAVLIARERAAAIMAALEDMPPAAARAFRMHRLEGLGHGEIAKRLGISKSGVEKHMAVALRSLVRALRTAGPAKGGVSDEE